MTRTRLPRTLRPFTPVAKSGTYTASGNDYVIATGSFTVTLPAPTAGLTVGVKSTNGTGAAPCTVLTPSGAILGPGVDASATSILLGTPGAFVTLLADGTNWHIVHGGQDTGWIALNLGAFVWHDFTGGNYQLCQYRKRPDGVVSLRGLAQISAGGGVNVCSLPAGFRPTRDLNSFVCKCALDASTNGYCLVDVFAASGIVSISVLFTGLAPNGNLSLDSISFDVNA